MTLTLPDDIINKTGLSQRDALIEFACHLYDAQKLDAPAASRLAGLSRGEFEDELLKRGLPLVRVTQEYWQQELQTLNQIHEGERK